MNSQVIELDRVTLVKGFVWHPTMTQLATTMYDPSSENRSLLIWNIDSEPNAAIDQTLDMQAGSRLSWHPNGNLIVTNQLAGVQIINTSTGIQTFLPSPSADEHINAVAWSPDGTKIVGGGDQIYVWDVSTGYIIETIETETIVEDVFWSPNSLYVYHTGGSEGVYRNGKSLYDAVHEMTENTELEDD